MTEPMTDENTPQSKSCGRATFSEALVDTVRDPGSGFQDLNRDSRRHLNLALWNLAHWKLARLRNARCLYASILALTVLHCILLPRVTHAQVTPVDGPHLTVTPSLGYVDWSKYVNRDNGIIYGGRAGLMMNRWIGLEAHYALGSMETIHGGRQWIGGTDRPPVDIDLQHYGLDAIFHVIPDAPVSPFLIIGWQEWKFDATPAWPEQTFENGPEFGAGVLFRAAPRVGIRAEVRDAQWKFDNVLTPNPPGEDSNDNLIFSVGVQFALGGESELKDADFDGIGDKKDLCPDTPLHARVDADGCPIDSDGDGIADGLDQCEATPRGASVDARGCPTDADGDGVLDGLDQCADTPAGATVDANGCTGDADGDGVFDGLDQCANTPTGATVDARGCTADSDEDGVIDGVDLCPHTPAGSMVDKDGCPIEISEKETELLDTGRITVRNINFATAKWDILPESYPVLDEVGNILIQWPELRIEIGGHADARGSDAYNLDLSDKRANSVLNYLLTRFPQIMREQYSAKGYGEQEPVATNDTVEGQTRNRRVEFKVLNTEALTKEKERRRLLQK